MTARLLRTVLMLVGLALGAAAGGGEAMAQCCAAPPPCCAPPKPPTPPPNPCNCHQINIPSVNVNVGATVVVNANSIAIAGATAGASAGASSQVYYGGGGGYWSVGESAPGMIQNLQVTGQGARRVSYQASRTRVKIMVIQASCIDDKLTPHPASQVTPDRDVEEGYEGELYRCIAGTHMQYTMAEYHGQVSFEHGQTADCAKGEALWRSGSGQLSCRPQAPARDCNERSLLRRFGAGVKIIKIVTTETYTAYREESVQSASAYSMTLDGGVGGMVR
jgi:hypothetical protein